MTKVVFYEKPRCGNNTCQKAMLRAAGHEVEERNLLTTPWTAEHLRPFFGELPVADWFNKAAPRVKSGEVDPVAQTATQALALMLADPLLIRRPLMEALGERRCGFDIATVDVWIGLIDPTEGDVETCPRSHKTSPCPAP